MADCHFDYREPHCFASKVARALAFRGGYAAGARGGDGRFRALGQLASEWRANGFARGATLPNSGAQRDGRLPCVRPRRINLFFRFFGAAPGFSRKKPLAPAHSLSYRDTQKHQCRDHKNPQCLHSKNPIAATRKTPMPTLENPIATTQKTPMPALENPIACTPDVAAAQCLHT